MPLPDLTRAEYEALLKLVDNATTNPSDRLPLDAFDQRALRELRVKLRQGVPE